MHIVVGGECSSVAAVVAGGECDASGYGKRRGRGAEALAGQPRYEARPPSHRPTNTHQPGARLIFLLSLDYLLCLCKPKG